MDRSTDENDKEEEDEHSLKFINIKQYKLEFYISSLPSFQIEYNYIL